MDTAGPTVVEPGLAVDRCLKFYEAWERTILQEALSVRRNQGEAVFPNRSPGHCTARAMSHGYFNLADERLMVDTAESTAHGVPSAAAVTASHADPDPGY